METLHSAADLLKALDLRAGSWAATDADGTLWAADVAELSWNRLLERSLMRDAAAAPMAAELVAAGGSSTGDVHRDARALFALYTAGAIDDMPILRAMTFCYAGWTEREVRTFASELAREVLAPHVYATTRELLGGLIAAGVNLAVVSGSPTLVVEEAVAALDLGATLPVRGTRLLPDNGVFSARLGEPITWNAGKVRVLEPLVGADRLAVAFGDTTGDRELLDWAQVGVLVHPRPSLREHATSAVGRWIEFAPHETASGRPVTPPSSDQIL